MNEDYMDNILTGLDQTEPSEGRRKASKSASGTKVQKSVAAPLTAREKPRGKRADPTKEQVNASVKKSLKTTAVAYLANEEKNRPEKPYKMEVGPLEHGNAPRSLSDLIEQLLAAWVEHKGGDLFKK